MSEQQVATQQAPQAAPSGGSGGDLTGFKALDKLPGRVVFKSGENSAEAAADHLRKILATPGFSELNLPMVVYGLQEDGSINWSQYDGQDIYVIMLRNKGQGYRALVVQPAPAIETLLTADEARAWVTDLLETQVAHKMVRSLRAPKGDTEAPITDGDIQSVPHSIADYVATTRLGGAVAFWNKHAKSMIDVIGERIPSFKAARVTKDFFRQALQSKPFAEAIYPSFEASNIFEKAGEALIKAGEKEGADVSTIRAWLDNRENVEAEAATGEIEDVEVDDLFGDLE